MSLEDLLIPVVLALAIGFLLGYYYVRAMIPAMEERMRAELEVWKRDAAGEIRKDSVNRSRSTLKGRIAEQMAPVLPDFCYNPADARFIGSPVDYIIFDGLTRVADEKEGQIQIIFMDVKKGNEAALTRTQRIIRRAVESRAVAWKTMRIPDE
jgi:predicted Holliday junction resolvase-like endonuclease